MARCDAPTPPAGAAGTLLKRGRIRGLLQRGPTAGAPRLELAARAAVEQPRLGYRATGRRVRFALGRGSRPTVGVGSHSSRSPFLVTMRLHTENKWGSAPQKQPPREGPPSRALWTHSTEWGSGDVSRCATTATPKSRAGQSGALLKSQGPPVILISRRFLHFYVVCCQGR